MSLRILHVTPYFVDAWAYGGIPRIATTLVRELARRGHRLTVCTTDAADAHQRARSGANVADVAAGLQPRVVDVAAGLQPRVADVAAGLQPRVAGEPDVRTFRNVSNTLAYRNQLFLPRGLGAFLKARASDFDIAHLHACRNLPVSIAARHLRHAGVPYVMAPNGTAPRIERRRLAKWAYDGLIGWSDLAGAAAVVAVTEAERRQLQQLGVDPGRIRIVPNPVDLDEHQQPVARGKFRAATGTAGARLVLFLGKLTPRKRVDVLIRALASGVDSDVRLVVAGNDMGAGAALAREARTLGVADRVSFVGLLRGADRLEALADADVVVYPSADEIFGLVPLEALLVGTPVVVADDSGCGEIISEIGGGLVVPLGDHRALAAAIQQVLGSPADWRTAARSSACRVRERFGAAVVAGQLDALYHDLIAAR